MNTKTSRSIITGIETFEEIKDFMNSNGSNLTALNSKFLGKYGSIKALNHFLPIMADFDKNKPESSLPLFKKSTILIQKLTLKPLLDSMIKAQSKVPASSTNLNKVVQEEVMSEAPELIVKWWITYLSILKEAFLFHRDPTDPWNINLDQKAGFSWFSDYDAGLLELTLRTLKEGNYSWWEIALSRSLCSKEEFFKDLADFGGVNTFAPNFDHLFKRIKKYELSLLKKEIDTIMVNKEKIDHTAEMRSSLLTSILRQITTSTSESLTKSSLISGYFPKTHITSLSHSVLIGDDGGHYALLNSISDDNEKKIILKTGFINDEYLQRISEVHPKDSSKRKVLIGKGSFGKIRLCLAITCSQTSNVMRPGVFACCKKTALISENFPLNQIRSNCWNDYLVVEIGHLVHSPDVYDLHIVEQQAGVEQTHCKGYTIQKYLPVLDGMKAFTCEKKDKKGKILFQEGPYYRQTVHQRAYFMDIFRGIINLLNIGICMTDLKPGNTLYNAKVYRGTLIDLSGVVIKKSRKELERTKVKPETEHTPYYTAPEFNAIFESEKFDTEIDLCKCASYTLGKMLEEAGFEDSLEKDFAPLTAKMLDPNPLTRLSCEEAFSQLQVILPMKPKLSLDFKAFIAKLRAETVKNLSSFGLNENIEKVKRTFINQNVSLIDLERYEVAKPELFELESEISSFLFKNQETIAFVLLGSSGSGKSTILQIQYLNALNSWEEGRPIPVFINLSFDTNLNSRWESLCTQLGIASTDPIYNFNAFTILEYPVTLFVDSFDEAAIKINFVSEFHEALGSNNKNKILICCRSEFIQNEADFQKYFTLKNAEINTSVKRFIVSLRKTEFSLTEEFISEYYANWSEEAKQKVDAKSIFQKITQEDVMGMLTTGYMVHLTLTVFPELLEELEEIPIKKRLFIRITKVKIYRKYIKNFLKKVDPAIKDFISNEFHSDRQKNESSLDFWMRFAKKAGMVLASTIHSKDSGSKIEKSKAMTFMKKYKYDEQIPCLSNVVLSAVIRGLDLVVEVKDKPPNERITLGFSHDTIKNFFLIESIKEDCFRIRDSNKKSKLLGLRLIVEDEVLIRFLAEAMKEDRDFFECLKEIIFKTREERVSKRICIAAANAITILVAGNISFAGQDLSRVKIKGACLRDGMFCGTDFTDADLTGTTLEYCKFDGALFERTNLTGAKFGILPDIVVKSNVLSCCFNPTNRNEILCGCSDNSMNLWNNITGDLITSFRDHSNWVYSVTFSSDGQMIVSGSVDQTLKLWDRSGYLLKTFWGHSSTVNSVAFSPNDQLIASGSRDKTIRLWERTTGNLLKTLQGHSNSVSSVVFSPDGNSIVSGSRDNTVKLWEISSGNLLKTLESHSESVYSVAFSPDGFFIASGSADYTTKLWERSSGNLLKTFQGHADWVCSVAFSPDGQFIASGSADKTIKLWGISTENLLKTFQGHTNTINSVAFSPDGQLIASGSVNTIKLWERSTGNLLKTFQGHSSAINAVAFSTDNQLIASGSEDKTIKIWDKSMGNALKVFQGHIDSVNSIAFSPDGQFIASGSNDKTLKLWELFTGNLVKTLQSHSNSVSSVAFSHDGRYLVSASKDKTVKLWLVSNGDLINTYTGHLHFVNAVVFSPQGGCILSGSSDHTVKIWGLSIVVPVNLEGHTDSVYSVAYSPDGMTIMSGSADNTIKLWSSPSGKIIQTLQSHTDWVFSVAYSPNGELIVSGSRDNTVKLWESSTGKLLKTFHSHSNTVNSVAFSPDGASFVSGSSDKTIKIWESSIEILLRNYHEDPNSDDMSAFSPDNLLIASIAADESIKLWERHKGTNLPSIPGDHNLFGFCLYFKDSFKKIRNTANFFNQLTICDDYSNFSNKNCFFINIIGLSPVNLLLLKKNGGFVYINEIAINKNANKTTNINGNNNANSDLDSEDEAIKSSVMQIISDKNIFFKRERTSFLKLTSNKNIANSELKGNVKKEEKINLEDKKTSALENASDLKNGPVENASTFKNAPVEKAGENKVKNDQNVETKKEVIKGDSQGKNGEEEAKREKVKVQTPHKKSSSNCLLI